MHTPPRTLMRRLERACELLACGYSWDVVARELKVRPHTLRSWPRLYREYWQRCLAEARQRSIDSGADKARQRLREHLRSSDKSSWREAAKLLLLHAIAHARRNHTDTNMLDFERMENYVEGLSDVEIATLLAQTDTQNAGRPLSSAPPGPETGCAA